MLLASPTTTCCNNGPTCCIYMLRLFVWGFSISKVYSKKKKKEKKKNFNKVIF